MIRLPAPLALAIREHGRRSYPEEGCGILVGDAEARRVTEVRPVPNKREDSRHNRYTIDPLDMRRIEKDVDARGLDILGIFHSHPNAPARPSEFDLGHAWPSLSYIIVSVRNGEPEDLGSFQLEEDRTRFREEELIEEE